MEDSRIIELYFAREETAVKKTAEKFGKYCYTIAYNILHNSEDSEECVNDTYLRAWNSIPPHKPNRLSAYLGKITRNLALNKYEKYTAAKRGGGLLPLALEELGGCVPESGTRTASNDYLTGILNRFLQGLKKEERIIFIRRYWYLSPVKEIAKDLGFGESRVKMSLLRTRKALKELLEQEGISL